MKFDQVLAIDVAERIDDFSIQIAKFSRAHRVSPSSSQNVDLQAFSATHIDAMVVSIYQELSEQFLSHFVNLKCIAVLGSSTKKIATDYCARRQIAVRPVTDYCDHETAEWVILQILKFFREQDVPHSCFEKQLGIVGVGAVGRLVAKYALSLGMHVVYNAPSFHDELEEMNATFCSKED